MNRTASPCSIDIHKTFKYAHFLIVLLKEHLSKSVRIQGHYVNMGQLLLPKQKLLF
jgi:hypothetical protein